MMSRLGQNVYFVIWVITICIKKMYMGVKIGVEVGGTYEFIRMKYIFKMPIS